MSVKVADRSLSKCEAVWQAQRIRDMVHDLCLRNFGIKDMNVIARKRFFYRCDPQVHQDRYIMLLTKYKKSAYDLSDLLCQYTKTANGIRMNSLENCQKRYDMQEKARQMCFLLLDKTQDAISTFLVDVNRYRQYTEALDHEITLITNWMSYTKQMMERF